MTPHAPRALPAPPRDPEHHRAERAILAALLLGRSIPGLSPEDFCEEAHRAIYRAAETVSASGAQVEPVAVETELHRAANGHGARISLSDLITLCQEHLTDAAIPRHVETLRRARILRETSAWAGSIALRAQRDEAPVDVLREARTELDAIAARAAPDVGPIARRLGDVVRADASRPPEVCVTTGMDALDEALRGGWRSRQLALVIGGPGTGKTNFGCWTAARVSQTRPVLYVSTELEAAEVAARFYAITYDVPLVDVTERRVSPSHVATVVDDLWIWVIGCDEIEESEDPVALIEHEARAIAASASMPLIVVDYAQQLVRSARDAPRVQVGDIGRRLRKSLAQGLDTQVIAVSSTSRAGYGRAGKAQAARDIADLGGKDDPRDLLATAKESGDLEYHAGTVIYLDVDGAVDEKGLQKARIRVAKCRRRGPGDVGAQFHGATGSWYPCADAVDSMSPEARERAKEDAKRERVAHLAETILRAVDSRQTPPTRADVHAIIGGNEQMCYAAIRRLIAEERLEESEVVRPNARGHSRKTKVLEVASFASIVSPSHE